MIKIKSQINMGDTDVRRLLGNLQEKKMATDRVIENIKNKVGGYGLGAIMGPSKGISEIANDPDIIRDLEFILGSEWQTIAFGNII